MDNKIAITGGEGLLSSELLKLSSSLIGFSKHQVNICDPTTFSLLDSFNTIIHTAALTNINKVQGNEIDFINTNIVGTANLSNYCIKHNKTLVYISTDYVYPGTGNHYESDAVFPFNVYAWSKLGGECSVKFVKEHLIIRTSFGASNSLYNKAFTNFYTSKDYVDIIAPLILKTINSGSRGIINVGTQRKSVFEWLNQRNNILPGIGPEKDYSLNLDKLNKI